MRTAPFPRLLTIAVAAFLLAALTGLAFAGWVGHGPGILMGLAEVGLSWCL